MTSFNPTRRIGAPARRGRRATTRASAARRRLARAVDRLRAVRITDPERRAHQYPHEFSGGMRQRAMIGMGLMGTPALIVADEPTTALDVTVQQQVLDLLRVDPRGRRRRAGADQPRRHRGRRGLRPRARDVRRPDRRGPARRRAAPRGRGIPTRGRSWPPSPTWTPTSTSRWPSSPVARSTPPTCPPGCAYAARCPLASDALPGRGPAARDRRRRAPGRLLARRRADPARVRGPAPVDSQPVEVS